MEKIRIIQSMLNFLTVFIYASTVNYLMVLAAIFLQITTKARRRQGKRQRNGKINGQQLIDDGKELIIDSENEKLLLNGHNDQKQDRDGENGKGTIAI